MSATVASINSKPLRDRGPDVPVAACGLVASCAKAGTPTPLPMPTSAPTAPTAPMKPRLFRLLNASHRSSVIVNPRWTAVSYGRRVTTAYRECVRVARVRIGTRAGVAPLIPASPSGLAGAFPRLGVDNAEVLTPCSSNRNRCYPCRDTPVTKHG